jgi:AcrR family transcriptional regulator
MAILRAAYELFAEHGYEATTIADIAEAAEVSPRTISIYFATKADIALSRFSEGVASLTDAIRARRPGQTVRDVFSYWLLTTQVDPEDLELQLLARQMFAANPELAALRTARMVAAIRECAAMIAVDTGLAADAIGPRLAAAAAAAMVTEIVDTAPGAERDRALAAAMRFLEAGTAALSASVGP